MSIRERLAKLESSAAGGRDADMKAVGGWDLTRLSDGELRWMASLYHRDGNELRLSAVEQREMDRLEALCT